MNYFTDGITSFFESVFMSSRPPGDSGRYLLTNLSPSVLCRVLCVCIFNLVKG